MSVLDENVSQSTFDTVEDDIDKLFFDENGTFFIPFYESEVYPYFALLIGITALVCNALIIYLIAKHKFFHNKTYLVVMNLCVCESLHKLTLPPYLILIFKESYENFSNTVICIDLHTDVIFLLGSLVLCLVLIFNLLMKAEAITIRILLICFYSSMLVIFVINTILCSVSWLYSFLYEFTFFFYCVVLLILLAKEVNKCYKARFDPLSEETVFRLNIVRIFIYNYLINFIFITFDYYSGILDFISALGYLSPLILLIYLYCADKKFQLCFINIFRRKDDKYDINATVQFTDDTANATPNINNGVSINMNGNHVA